MNPPKLGLVLLVSAAALILLYTVPRRTPPKLTRYDHMVDSAYTLLPEKQVDSFKILEKDALGMQGEEQKLALLDLARRWEQAGWAPIAAERYRQAADIEPLQAEQIGIAADKFFALIPGAKEDAERVDYVFRAIYGYEKALELNPDDLDRKVRLAECYSDHQGNVMQGVLLLREVAEKDPGHVEAQMRLGRFALISGQTDRAIERFSAVLSQDSLNLPARILLAQTLYNNRDAEGARALLREGIALHPDAEARLELEGLLAQIVP
jgi:tetratricopeptide (TPR) repeat protein